MRFQKPAVLPFQKMENRVWSAVRAALLVLPMSLLSLKSAVYWALVSAGGPGVRNCVWDGMSQGVM